MIRKEQKILEPKYFVPILNRSQLIGVQYITMSQVSQYIGARARFQDKRRSRSTPPAPARGPQKRSWWWLTRVWRPIKEHTRVMTPPRTPSLPAEAPSAQTPIR